MAEPTTRSSRYRGILARSAPIVVRWLSMAIAPLVLTHSARADAVADFYKVTPIAIVVSSAPGGGYDAYARFLARYMARHIPGTPTMVVKNMPGAGGATAGNYLATAAPRDGTMLAMLQNTLTIDQLTRSPALKFDMRELSWIGSMNINLPICVFSPRVRVQEPREFLARKITIGASGGSTALPVLVPTLLNALVGTKFDIIKGYDGTNSVFLAIEQGEVDGICGIGWDSVQIQAMAMVDAGTLRVGLDIRTEPNADLRARGVPSVLDMVAEGENKRVLQLLLSPSEYGRPFAAAAGVPIERLGALRQAFAETMRDPEFLADAKKANLEIEPRSAQRIQEALAEALDAPKPVQERALTALRDAGWTMA